MKNKAWIRVLNVFLTSELSSSGQHRRLSFGTNFSKTSDDLSIRVTLNKYMSSLKDEAIVELRNLTYADITRIVNEKFFNVEIQCGYKYGNVQTIFKGGLLYISNQLTDNKTNTVILICTSYMVAKYGQRRLNLSLNSGINMYTQIKEVLAKSGIRDGTVSAQVGREQLLEEAESITKSAPEYFDDLLANNETMIINTDSGVTGSTISIYDAAKSNSRVIKVDASNIILTGGFPRLTNEGLELSMLPTFAFACGDVIQIDNSLIDISVNSRNEVSKNYGYYLDKNGCYMIMSMRYVLENRGSQFGLSLKCKTRSLISNYIGGIE